MPKVSEAHKAEVRSRLLAAAEVCMRRNGWQGLTTRELLAEAGLSTGTLYNYFPTKEQLYEALAQELLADDVVRLLAEEREGLGMAAGLFRFLRQYMLTESDAAAAVSMFRSRVDDGEAVAAVRRFNAWVVTQFAPLVERGQAEGLLRTDLDVEALVELLDMVWDGLGRRTVQASFRTSFERVGDELVAVLLAGVLQPGAALPDDPPA